jgi:hypothetical protein
MNVCMCLHYCCIQPRFEFTSTLYRTYLVCLPPAHLEYVNDEMTINLPLFPSIMLTDYRPCRNDLLYLEYV